MVYKVFSGRVGGIFGDLITVEVDASAGLPCFEMIGLLGSEVREAKERVRVALKNNGINIPAMRITVNLSPADEHKQGSAFDLPIAVAILGVFGHIKEFNKEDTLIIGELSLDGDIRPVRGILPIVSMAHQKGFKRVILPRENAPEGALIKEVDIIPVSQLCEVISYLSLPAEAADIQIEPYIGEDYEHKLPDYSGLDFSDVCGQENAKRAAMIAAAGFHHLLFTGPPGTGKSLIAKRIPGIMPSLSYDECLEVTTIYSVAGLLNESRPFVKERPFWSPHHGASAQSITGGGLNVTPGLVSLSHRGILFLDEIPEFKRNTIDLLRQPLEDGTITVSRVKGSVKYPAGFMLVAAMNPCPCGYYPDRNRCNCTQTAIDRYLAKLSGPIMDRIDICVDVARIDPSEIEEGNVNGGLSSEEMRKMVEDAVNIQKNRYKDENFFYNSQIPSSKIEKYILLGEKEKRYILNLYNKMNLSMRSYYKVMRVARTIADLEKSEAVLVRHLAEASCYRFPDYMKR